MPANLTRLTTISRQPSLRDYDPGRHHSVPLSFILHSNSQNHATVSDMLGDRPLPVQQDEPIGDGSFTILLYDATAGKVKELVFSAEEDFDSNVLNILEPARTPGQDKVTSSKSFDFEAGAHYCDPLLYETSLRCVLAQGNSTASLSERLEMAENLKRAFSLLEPTHEDAQARAIKGASYRQPELQAQLKDLQQDKGWTLLPDQCESPSLYEKCKCDDIRALSDVEVLVQSLPSFSGEIQVSILSVDKLSNDTAPCMKARSCYRWPDAPQVYCTLKVTNMNKKTDTNEDKFINYKTKEAVFIEHGEWHDKSPWISINSVDDHLCIRLWQKNPPARPGKGYKELDMRALIRNVSQRRTKIAGNEDIMLGQVVLPVSRIESQVASSGKIFGRIPSRSYTVRNVRGERSMLSLQLEVTYRCELLNKGAPPEKNLLKPPLEDLEAAYDALVEVAFGMLLEGEFQLEEPWPNILSCFETHYRLRRERCCLVVLKNMAAFFEPQVDYLTIVVQMWRPICKAAKERQLKKGELFLHAQTISLLIKPAIQAIEDFQSIFYHRPPNGAIAKLIELLSLLLCWDPSPIGVLACLRRWVKVSCAQRFEKLLSENSNEGEITSKTFSLAISLLRKDFETLTTCFQKEFPEDLDLFQLCASEYYKLISHYIIGIVGTVRISSKDFEDLTRELSLLHKELEIRHVAMELIDLHGLLKEFILELIAAIKPRMIDWIISSINDEKWEPISAQTDAFFSFSVIDLYFMVNGVVENMTTRLSYFPFGKLYYAKIEESICAAVETYLQITEKLCLQELPDNFDEEHHHFLSHFKSTHNSTQVCVSKALCVKLNNLHALLQQQISLEASLAKKWENFSPAHMSEENGVRNNWQSKDLKRSMMDDPLSEERVGQRFEKLKRVVQLSISNVTGSIVECMQYGFTKRLQKLMEASSNKGVDLLRMEDLELLTNYLDDHLKVLNEWLVPEIFRCLLLEIAGALIFCMEEFALNRDEDPHPMTAKQRVCLEQALNLFYDYFYGDGVGISKLQMDGLSARLRNILACSDLLTRDLCSLYWKAWDKFNAEANDHTQNEENAQLHVLDFLLLLQQRDDEEARIIATNQKLLAKNKLMQTHCWREKESHLKAQFEMPREMIRGVAQYLKAIQTPFPSLNVSYSAFQKMKRW